jgi:heme/copper-type cytochrome/quinol oxidase subunit 2
VLAFLGKTKFVVIPGLLALALMAVTYFTFESRMGELRSTLQNNPYGQTVASSTGMSWGWIVLIPGALAMVYAGIVAWRGAAAAPRGPTY